MNLRARLWMFAIVVSVVGCREEADRPPEPDPVPEAPAWQAPGPELAPAIDRTLGAGFELRRPVIDGRLTVVPIIATRATSDARYITLGAGLATGAVEVTEWNGLIVDTLLVHNHSDRELFALQGELLVDGMQDRVIARSAIIAAGETTTLLVQCVEHSRSTGAPAFRAGGAIVELSLRRTIAHEQQVEVWRQVDAINQRLHFAPPTHTYRMAAAAQAQGDNAARRTQIFEQLARREEHDLIVGFAVAIDGELVALDRFATPALFRELEVMLLASYGVDTDGPARVHSTLDPVAIRRFAASPLAVTTPASTTVLTERSAAEKQASLVGVTNE